MGSIEARPPATTFVMRVAHGRSAPGRCSVPRPHHHFISRASRSTNTMASLGRILPVGGRRDAEGQVVGERRARQNRGPPCNSPSQRAARGGAHPQVQRDRHFGQTDRVLGVGNPSWSTRRCLPRGAQAVAIIAEPASISLSTCSWTIAIRQRRNREVTEDRPAVEACVHWQ